MSKITIIPADSVIGVDGVFQTVDLTDIDAEIHAVQFDTGTGAGHIEYVGHTQPNKPIGKTAFRPFEKYITRWKAASEPAPRTLEQAKADKHDQINSMRDNLEQGGFPYMGKVLDSNSISVQRITVVAQAAQAALATGTPFTINWMCQDNTVLVLDAAGAIGMPAALAMHANQLHQHGREKKALIDSATTIEAVDAIQW